MAKFRDRLPRHTAGDGDEPDVTAAPPAPGPVGGVSGYGKAAFDRELRALAAEPEGSRNGRLNIAAFNLAQLVAAGHLQHQPTWDALYDTAVAIGLTVPETANTLRSAFGAGTALPRQVPALPEPPTPTIIDVATLAACESKVPTSDAGSGEPVQPDPLTWEPVDLGHILDGTYTPELPTLMPRADGSYLLYPGRVHSFHGESESGKSMVAQAVAKQQLDDETDVLYVDFESGAAAVVGRLLELGAEPRCVKTHFVYVRPETDPRKFPAEREAVTRLLTRPYAYAVVDGVTDALAVFGMETNDNDAVTTWMRLLPRAIARLTGAAVVLVDHVTKATDSRGRFALGAQAKMSSLDGAAYVVEVSEALGRGRRGLVTLRVAKDRPGGVRAHAGPFRKLDRTQEAARVVVDARGDDGIVVTVDNPLTEEEIGPGASRPTVLMERISTYLENREGSVSKARLEEVIRGNTEARQNALRILRAEGYVLQTKVGTAHHQESLVPYRAHRDPLSDSYIPDVETFDPTTRPDLDQIPTTSRPVGPRPGTHPDPTTRPTL